jgi:HEAT repeat protein
VCLRQIGQPSVAGLIETLRTGDSAAAAHAVGALSGIGPPAVAPLLEFASVADARTLGSVREALSHMREEALPVLLERAADPDPVIRSTVALALGGIGSPDSVETLARMVTDTDDGVRHAALDGLGLLGWDGVEELLLISHRFKPRSAFLAGECWRIAPLAKAWPQAIGRPPRRWRQAGRYVCTSNDLRGSAAQIDATLALMRDRRKPRLRPGQEPPDLNRVWLRRADNLLLRHSSRLVLPLAQNRHARIKKALRHAAQILERFVKRHHVRIFLVHIEQVDRV